MIPVIREIVRTLQVLCAHNDQEPLDTTSIWSSTPVPRIALDQYIVRFQRYLHPTVRPVAVFIVATMYMDTILRRIPTLHIHSQTVHRLFLVCLLLATKILIDHPPSNQTFARIGGISLRSLNRLERQTLGALQYQLEIQPRDYITYKDALYASCHKTNKQKQDETCREGRGK